MPFNCFVFFRCFVQVITEVPQEEVELSLVRADLGAVTQSDVEAAALAEAPIFAFNVGNVPPAVKVSDHRRHRRTRAMSRPA